MITKQKLCFLRSSWMQPAKQVNAWGWFQPQKKPQENAITHYPRIWDTTTIHSTCWSYAFSLRAVAFEMKVSHSAQHQSACWVPTALPGSSHVRHPVSFQVWKPTHNKTSATKMRNQRDKSAGAKHNASVFGGPFAGDNCCPQTDFEEILEFREVVWQVDRSIQFNNVRADHVIVGQSTARNTQQKKYLYDTNSAVRPSLPTELGIIPKDKKWLELHPMGGGLK